MRAHVGVAGRLLLVPPGGVGRDHQGLLRSRHGEVAVGGAVLVEGVVGRHPNLGTQSRGVGVLGDNLPVRIH